MKILIAEDDVTSLYMLRAVTNKWGYDPVTVEDGGAAWKALQDPEAPRLLILDWKMPIMDGIELCKAIRQQETSDPPYIILLTAQRETHDLVEGLESGANDYVVKPFDNAELKARLQVGRRMLALQEELNATKTQLIHQATHDSMLGIYNRGAIINAIEEDIERASRTGQVLTIGMLDLDHFKQINDQFGHLAGDEVLCEFCRRVENSIRPYDHFGRYGGEEFIISSNTGARDAIELFERIRSNIVDQPFIYQGQTIPVTTSTGLTYFQQEKNLTTLLAEADAALYSAKQSGRNCVRIYEQLTNSQI
ncbi:diguanylate cyclase [Motiliproteus sp. MSK22-1]|uniref:GGDEF domain-containing protein n=1 Tax=Motiliproteus sp. MSK22-1 TaxID=1897630 RepID=UPI0009788110|nr:diguanylate cyclase [Motiliproteus sp. MSK22-1]OMH30432.1 diguanylate cyclase response regulator [Motiliproteus sp. MSK22-1]